ncbi:hypothetical protein EEB14_48540 [Rhodococcus sp. WS4]|nr:hypothetical protein EEB14_48540 [Rhodococcus sp. WS4]
MQPSDRVRALPRRARVAITVMVVFAALLVIGPRLVAVYTDWLWFGEVGYRRVWGTVLVTRLLLFTAVTVVVAAVIFAAMVWAYRSRPLVAAAGSEKDPLGPYRMAVLARPRRLALGVPLLLALPFGLHAQANWAAVQLFLRGGGFGAVDAEFGHDIGFYVFDLPFYRMVLNWLFFAVFLALLASVGVHYLFGGIRLSVQDATGNSVSGPARVQLAVLAGTFIALKAVAYWFDRYALLSSGRKEPTFSGAGYTDINAVLPARLFLLAIAVLCAGAFFAAIVVRDRACQDFCVSRCVSDYLT